MQRALRGFSTALIIVGVLLIADAVVTVVWQEPVSALYARITQDHLNGDLKRLEGSGLAPGEKRALADADAPRRLAYLARSLRRRVKPGQAIGRISIPKIGARYVVVQGTDAANLRKGPGHYPHTPLPGLRGTVAIAGHRTTYLAPFRRVNQLRHGDRIVLEMPYGRFTYRVERLQIVLPTALWVTRRVGHDRLVLSACHPLYSATRRIIVFARLTDEAPRGAALRA